MASSDFLTGFLADFTSSAYTARYDSRGSADPPRPLLFHRLLSLHPALPTPEGSSVLRFQALPDVSIRHTFRGLHSK